VVVQRLEAAGAVCIGPARPVAAEGNVFECKARGIFRKNEMTPLVGDRVIFSIIDPAQKKGSIDQILDRDSLLARPAIANINQLIAVIAAKSPEPDLLLLDKLLVTAGIHGIKSILCINKIDQDEEDRRRTLVEAYTKAGYSVIETSLKVDSGFDELKSALKGKISVFAGQSGVGKSTLLNRVMDTMVMKTGDLSGKIERGRHTTRHAELLELTEGGYIADTPGFSSYELTGLMYTELQHYYPEIERQLGGCRFTGCSHISEPDCKVKEALETGLINKARYERYITLYNTLKQIKDYGKKNK
jgi:ribosome biogenesis GTPase